MVSKTIKKQRSKKAAGESEASSTTSNDVYRKVPPPQPLALFLNSKLLPTGFIISEFLPAEERDRLKRYFVPEWSVPPREANCFLDSTVFPVMKTLEEFSLDEFPDELLVEVFRRVHNTDRIRSVSLVCRRWNRLLYTPGLWKNVYIEIGSVKQFNAAKAFLKREDVSHSLVKLNLRYSHERLSETFPTTKLLPEKLPKLLHYHVVGEVVDVGFEFLDDIMPMLQTLILENVSFLVDNRAQYSIPYTLSVDASKCLFKNLRNLSIDYNLIRIFPWRTKAKELDVFSAYFERENVTYPELERLRVRELGSWPSFLQTLRFSSKLVALDISVFYPDRNLLPQLITAVRNLRFLEHLHMFVSDVNFPVAGLFAPPKRKSDFPSCLRYLSLSYLEPIVFEEVTLSCPELRSLYLNTYNRYCVISKSMFIQIAERLRKLVYLRVNYVSSSVASMLNALGEDALPHLRYLHSDVVMQDIPPGDYGIPRVSPRILGLAFPSVISYSFPDLEDEYIRNLTLAEMAEMESLLSKRPRLTVVCGPLSSKTWFINGKANESLDRSLLHRLLGSEEGACCTRLYEPDVGQRV